MSNTPLVNTFVVVLGRNPKTGELLAATFDNCFVSGDDGETWQALDQIAALGRVSAVGYNRHGETLLAIAGKAKNNNALWRRTRENKIIESNTGLATGIAAANILLSPEGWLFCLQFGRGVFVSLDDGRNWFPLNEGLSQARVECLALDQKGTLFCGTKNSQVFRIDTAAAVRAVKALQNEDNSF